MRRRHFLLPTVISICAFAIAAAGLIAVVAYDGEEFTVTTMSRPGTDRGSDDNSDSEHNAIGCTLSYYAASTGSGLINCATLKDVRAIPRDVASISMHGGVNDAKLEAISSFPLISYLDIHHRHTGGTYLAPNTFTATGLVHLAKLSKLWHLDIGGNDIDASGWACIARCQSLTYISYFEISYLGVGKPAPELNEGLGYLREHPNLKKVVLEDSHSLDDSGLAHIAAIPNLGLLNIGGYLHRHHPDKAALHIASFLAEAIQDGKR